MGTGRSGLYNTTYGSRNKLPKNTAQIKHIFRKSKGHLVNNSKNRKTLLDLINNESYYVGTDKDGCKWYIRLAKNGAQYWAKVKNGNLSNGGYNRSPKPWDEETGLNKNPNKNKEIKK